LTQNLPASQKFVQTKVSLLRHQVAWLTLDFILNTPFRICLVWIGPFDKFQGSNREKTDGSGIDVGIVDADSGDGECPDYYATGKQFSGYQQSGP
jgi:hypothetical protein